MSILLAICFIASINCQETSNLELQVTYDYLFSVDEQTAYNLLASPEERNKFVRDYWQRNDPSPETPTYNEMNKAFVERIDLANFFLSSIEEFVDGWKSDRGKVYIFFGPPTEIHRSPFGPTAESKYEIWVYSVREPGGNRKTVELTFIDENDVGSFTLVTQVKFPTMIILEASLPEIIKETADGSMEQ